ncbi:MAG: hypothetical protein ACSHX7_03605 [Luteolibacter sp.]
MKRSFIVFSLIAVGILVSIGLLKLRNRGGDDFSIVVVNNSNDLLGNVRLRGVGNVGELGAMSAGVSKRLNFSSAQEMENVFLSFEGVDQKERNTGTILHQVSDPRGQLIKLQIRADHSVSESHEMIGVAN